MWSPPSSAEFWGLSHSLLSGSSCLLSFPLGKPVRADLGLGCCGVYEPELECRSAWQLCGPGRTHNLSTQPMGMGLLPAGCSMPVMEYPGLCCHLAGFILSQSTMLRPGGRAQALFESLPLSPSCSASGILFGLSEPRFPHP